ARVVTETIRDARVRPVLRLAKPFLQLPLQTPEEGAQTIMNSVAAVISIERSDDCRHNGGPCFLGIERQRAAI
ncbi:MAG: hypothetical protein QOK04_2828, partial [Solirubrobacteraceae bacterium]|nr:hypothetical protein [Solirubrobacteraceae bacterium]